MAKKTKPRDPGFQIAWMRNNFPNFKHNRLDHGLHRWWGELQPSETSTNYLVEILWHPNRPPVKVCVLTPELHPSAKKLHRYSDGSLCLYYPNDGDWFHNMAIAQAIAPWAAEWLYYYEYWLQFGEWLGKEAPHRPHSSKP
jgi:hypothetical protein